MRQEALRNAKFPPPPTGFSSIDNSLSYRPRDLPPTCTTWGLAISTPPPLSRPRPALVLESGDRRDQLPQVLRHQLLGSHPDGGPRRLREDPPAAASTDPRR